MQNQMKQNVIFFYVYCTIKDYRILYLNSSLATGLSVSFSDISLVMQVATIS
jgi:hypothetical protein